MTRMREFLDDVWDSLVRGCLVTGFRVIDMVGGRRSRKAALTPRELGDDGSAF